MTEETRIGEERELTPSDVDAQQVTELPDREAMSLVNANLALPINASLAANVLSDGAIAASNAEQTTPINQGQLTTPITF